MSESAVPTTSLGVANLALNHLGQKRITAIDTTTEIGRKVDSAYSPAIYETLRDIKPNFAKKRAIFHHVVQATKTITGATAADPVVITVAAHGFSNDDVIAIWDMAGMTNLNGRRFIIQNVTTNTFSLTDEAGSAIDGSEFDAYTSGGSCGLVADPPVYGYTYRYTLPSDYIFLLELNGEIATDGTDFEKLNKSIENNEMLLNDSTAKGQYIYANTTVSNWDIDFLMLCSYKLAALLATSITNLSSLAKTWEDKYISEKGKSKGAKSQESGRPRKAICDQWMNARNGS